jgi:Arc/MetJ-type ribon-helix-helix transcriptional regulator
MATINISLPDKLKKQAEKMIKNGEYSSFSDLVRTGLRKIIREVELDMVFEEAKRDYLSGRANVLENIQDIDNYLKRLKKESEDNNDKKIRSRGQKLSSRSKIVSKSSKDSLSS